MRGDRWIRSKVKSRYRWAEWNNSKQIATGYIGL
jgi:hypothetical protein